MGLPETRKPPAPQPGAIRQSDQQGDQPGNTNEAQSTALGIETSLVAALFDCRTAGQAAEIVASITVAPTDPVLAWAVRMARRATDNGLVPSPAVCGEIARETADCPPGLLPTSTLFSLATDPPPPANVEWLVGRYLANVARRRIDTAAVRLAEIAWRGDLAEVEQAVVAEFHSLRTAFADAKAVAG